jgi:hypothetical protein
VAQAEVVPIHEETPQAVYNRYRREGMAFKRLFPQDLYRLWDLFHNLSTNIASDISHAARQHKLISHLGEIFWFRWMQFWGTYKVLPPIWSPHLAASPNFLLSPQYQYTSFRIPQGNFTHSV